MSRNRRSAIVQADTSVVVLTCANGFTPGFEALAERLHSTSKFTIIAVAPDKDCEALGSAVSKTNKVQVRKTSLRPPGMEAYIVQGTAVDCVNFGLEKARNIMNNRGASSAGIGGKIPGIWVVSGLNLGATVGVSGPILSGGTMAAVAGAVRNYRAISFGLEMKENEQETHFFDVNMTSLLASEILSMAVEEDLPDGITLNVNFPAFSGVYNPAGVAVCPLSPIVPDLSFVLDQKTSTKRWQTFLASTPSPNEGGVEGEEGGEEVLLAPEGTDVAELAAENITITPLRGVSVDEKVLQLMRSWDWMPIIIATATEE